MKKIDIKSLGILSGAVFVVLLLLIFVPQSSSNRAYSLEEAVQSAKSDISVKEKRRFDLLYNLADCVAQYDMHEAETLKGVIKERQKAGAGVTSAQLNVQALAESYPELKASENYKNLMSELAISENLIAEYRETYNNSVKKYNRYTKRFPTRIFLQMTGYKVVQFKYLEFENLQDSPSDLFVR